MSGGESSDRGKKENQTDRGEKENKISEERRIRSLRENVRTGESRRIKWQRRERLR